MNPTPDAATPLAAARRRGFTLVELLIVIGIIAVLAGLLLAVRSRATDKAAQAQCMNNLRQIGMALISYAQDNQQVFPLSAPLSGNTSAPHQPGDWIQWRGGPVEHMINKSAIARYVGAKGNSFVSLMRCPADEFENHSYPYPYSYSMSYILSPDASVNVGPPTAPGRPPTPRLSAINRPAEKILVAEENELTINDGLWAPGNYTDVARAAWIAGPDWLSIRHDTRKAEFDKPTAGVLAKQKNRGCVVFVDGHVDYVSRLFAHDPRNLLPNNEGSGQMPPPPQGG